MYDTIIVGAGPAGATAAIYTAMAGLKTLVIDKSLTAGALASAKKIFNYPGFIEGISGIDLLKKIREHSKSCGAEYLNSKVVSVEIRRNLNKRISEKVVYTVEGKEYISKSLIVSTGAMGKDKEIIGERKFLGKGVSYCAICDAPLFRDKVVLVAGSTDEALSETELLTKFARKVFLAVNGKEILSDETSLKSAKQNKKIEILFEHEIKEIIGDEEVKEVKLMCKGKEITLPVDGVFLYLQGTKPITDFLKGICELDENGYIKVDKNYQTSVDGIFACGDVVYKEKRQVVIAAAEGCITALNVCKYLKA